MQTFVITPKDRNELERLQAFLADAHLSAKILTDEEKEDFGMLLLLSEVDTSETVSEEEIRRILAGQ